MTTSVGRFRTRSVEIDAIQYTGDNGDEVVAWIHSVVCEGWRATAWCASGEVLVGTPKGVLTAKPSDWVLRGIHGQIDICDAHLFTATADRIPTDFYV